MRPWIVGLDPSLTATGLCQRNGRALTISVKGTGPERLVQLRAQIAYHSARSLDGDNFGSPGLVVIEGYSYASHSAAYDLGELGGVLRTWLWSEGIPYVEVPPSTLKKFATGKGTAKKEQMLVAAVKRLGYMGHSHNEADALWLWAMGRVAYRLPVGGFSPTKEQQAVVAKIDWPELDEVAA